MREDGDQYFWTIRLQRYEEQLARCLDGHDTPMTEDLLRQKIDWVRERVARLESGHSA